MFERTSTGFRISFDVENPLLYSLERGLYNLIADIWDFMTRLPLSRERGRRAASVCALIEVAMFYLEELGRCNDSSAFFAAGCVGTSALEAILIIACVRQQNQIVQTKAWKAFAHRNRKRGVLFKDLIYWIELGVLVSIGEEVGWFPIDDSIQNLFAAADEGWEEALAEIPSLGLNPREAIRRLQSFRNFLHPGKCVREKLSPHDLVGKECLGLLYVSLAGVLQYHSGPEVGTILLDVPKPVLDFMEALDGLKKTSETSNLQATLPAETPETAG
ncbi:hypothetical protein JAO29_16830 [Edaphobacter sp. HDX4]|uniref:hypothetical protein n=1 Tax=Edaphobacter sp. HDX4 TaxID=2794064 RepID=UPI002FE62025